MQRIKNYIKVTPHKSSIWDLINSTRNRRDERDVQMTGGMRGMCKRLFFIFFYVYETEFVLRSLREEAPPQSLSLCHHAPVAPARWQ